MFCIMDYIIIMNIKYSYFFIILGNYEELTIFIFIII